MRDAVAVQQAMHVNQNGTFDDVARSYTENLVKGFKYADVIMDIFDRYDSHDLIKHCERSRQDAVLSGSRIYGVKAGRTVPPWKKFIKVSANKLALVHFINNYVVSYAPIRLYDNTKRSPNFLLVRSVSLSI